MILENALAGACPPHRLRFARWLTHSIDVRFSKTSTVNYNVDKLQEMIEMVHRMYCEPLTPSPRGSVTETAVKARASREAARDRKKAAKDSEDKGGHKVKARAPNKPDLSVEGEWLPGRMMQHFCE